jgi:choice-of-anchor B domain-containing protein
MRHALLSVLLGLCTLSSSAQDALNMTLLGHLPYAQNLSDVRGALHNGREYALVGVFNGFSIVDVSNPANPVQVFFEPGGNSIWRDPFYYNGHAYCVNETSGGLLIVDMSPLPAPGPAPQVTVLPVTYYTGGLYPWTTAHNISFDGQGHAYIYGANYGVGGTIILDCSQNPAAPVELGVWNQYYVHDGFVRGDTLWAACVNDGIAAVVDISNPASPQVLATWATPSNFTHNIWPSDDNRTVYTTDEVSSGYVAAYDVTDLSNVVEIDRVNHPLSEGVIPHNAHFFNDYIVTSHYRDGVTVHDASDPSNMILTGYYDSSPESGSGFNGSWGTWPYLPSGIILNADIEEGLFILAPTYTRGARIEGTVTSASSGVQLSGVNVQVTGTAIAETTGIAGTYASGLAQGGSFTVTFVKGGFLPVTVDDVQLVNGQTTVLDVEMTSDTPFTLQVNVTNAGNGEPLEGTTITFVNSLFNITASTDANGIYLDENFFDGTYDITVGRWGNRTVCGTYTLNAENDILEIDLYKQYYDDFALDFGWEVTGPASTGVWERGAPIGTFHEGNMANPDSHSGSGCANFAFVTGNAGPPVNIDDVDDGATILTSPVMDLSNMTQSVISFQYWFYTGGGSSPSNDEMLVRVLNGTDIVTIESLSTTGSQWQEAAFVLSHFISITDEMRVQFFIQDAPPGHLVEGGIDFFQVDDIGGTSELNAANNLRIFPNPSTTGEVFISTSDFSGNATVRLLDLQGREVSKSQTMTSNPFKITVPDHSGIYLIEVTDRGARSFGRVVVAPN